MKRILLENETNTSVTCKQHSAFPSSFSCLSISLTSKLIPDLILFNVFCIFLWHPQKKKLSAFTVDSFSQPSVILGQYFKNTSHFQYLVMAALRRACIHFITYILQYLFQRTLTGISSNILILLSTSHLLLLKITASLFTVVQEIRNLIKNCKNGKNVFCEARISVLVVFMVHFSFCTRSKHQGTRKQGEKSQFKLAEIMLRPNIYPVIHQKCCKIQCCFFYDLRFHCQFLQDILFWCNS